MKNRPVASMYGPVESMILNPIESMGNCPASNRHVRTHVRGGKFSSNQWSEFPGSLKKGGIGSI